MTFTFEQLAHFAKTMNLGIDAALMRKLFDAQMLETPVGFFEIIAPSLKQAGIDAKMAAGLISKLNKCRGNTTVDVVLTALGLDAKVVAALTAGGASLADVRGLSTTDATAKGITPAQGRAVIKTLGDLGEVLDGLDAELRIKPTKK